MDLQIIRKSEMSTTAWSGGDSEQICIFPHSGTLDEKNFNYRCSLASIKNEETEFTSMENVSRIFMAIDPFRLDIDGDGYKVDKGDSCQFNGDQKVTCKGKGDAFNIMIGDPNYRAMVQILELQPGEFITEKIQNHHFYYVYKGNCIVRDFSFSEVLHEGDLITIEAGLNHARLKIMTEKVLQLIRVDVLKSSII